MVGSILDSDYIERKKEFLQRQFEPVLATNICYTCKKYAWYTYINDNLILREKALFTIPDLINIRYHSIERFINWLQGKPKLNSQYTRFEKIIVNWIRMLRSTRQI